GGVQAILNCPEVEVDRGKNVHLGVVVKVEGGEPDLKVVKEIRVNALNQKRPLVIGLEGLPDVIGLVGEVEDHRFLFAGMNAIQAAQGLDRVDTIQPLIDVHGVEERLVEAGLELIRNDQKAIVVVLEGGGRLPLRHTVHVGFGVV